MKNDCTLIKTSELNKLKEPKQKVDEKLIKENERLHKENAKLRKELIEAKNYYESNPKIDPMKIELVLLYQKYNQNGLYSYSEELMPFFNINAQNIKLDQPLRKQIYNIIEKVSKNLVKTFSYTLKKEQTYSYNKGKIEEKEKIKKMGFWKRKKYLK